MERRRVYSETALPKPETGVEMESYFCFQFEKILPSIEGLFHLPLMGNTRHSTTRISMIFEKIQAYLPKNEQEKADKRAILRFIETNPDYLERTNEIAHLTSSAIVVNESMTKILFAFHNIYHSWSWVGGHNDGEEDCLNVALRETMEETGVKNVRPWSDDIFMMDIIYVHNHIKRGKFVPDHLHLNVTYLMIADENDELFVKHDENSGVRWFAIDEVLHHVDEERMVAVYTKAFEGIRKIKEEIK